MIDAGRLLKATGFGVVAEQSYVTEDRGERRRGLLGMDSMPDGFALVITRCRQVHSYGMRFPIDVVFVDMRGKVIRICEPLMPGSISPISLRSSHAVELRDGSARRTGLSAGDQLLLERHPLFAQITSG